MFIDSLIELCLIYKLIDVVLDNHDTLIETLLLNRAFWT